MCFPIFCFLIPNHIWKNMAIILYSTLFWCIFWIWIVVLCWLSGMNVKNLWAAPGIDWCACTRLESRLLLTSISVTLTMFSSISPWTMLMSSFDWAIDMFDGISLTIRAGEKYCAVCPLQFWFQQRKFSFNPTYCVCLYNEHVPIRFLTKMDLETLNGTMEA